ncbi:hypothetical protein HD553DRAFT_366903, partial [Filobasidium floriforme]|uniref:uncharacterized protein n=1 Tax=Filobasidium floriforme TaxID=5210 RepID=UPI001E8EC045
RVSFCGQTSGHRQQIGTTVTIRQLFQNIPIRRKTGSLAAQRQTLLRIMERSAIGSPRVGMTLFVKSNNRIEASSLEDSSYETVFRHRSQRDDQQAYRKLLNIPDDHQILSVRASVNYGSDKHSIKVDGILGDFDNHSRSQQYLYVNGFHLERCELHETIEDAFRAELSARDDIVKGTQRRKNPDDDLQITAYPLFVIKLKLGSDRTDLSYQTDKSSLTLQDLFVVKEALSRVIRGLLGRFNKADGRPPHLDSKPTIPERQLQESIHGCEDGTVIMQDPIREDLARTSRMPCAEMGYQAGSDRALSVPNSQSRHLKLSSIDDHRKGAVIELSTLATHSVPHQPVGLSPRSPV